MSDLSLRVTLRCLTADLGLPEHHAKQDARDFADRHEVVRVFVDTRGTNEESGEPIQSLPPLGSHRSLHCGRGRAVTRLDVENDVCWLLGYHAFHADGDRKDVYKVLESLQGRGELQPTPDDYERLFEVTPEDLIEALRASRSDIVWEARAFPGKEVVRTFVASVDTTATTTMTVDLVFEASEGLEQGWVGLEMPPNVRWPAGGAIALATALMPDEVQPEDVQHSQSVGARPRRPTELAFTWSIERRR